MDRSSADTNPSICSSESEETTDTAFFSISSHTHRRITSWPFCESPPSDKEVHFPETEKGEPQAITTVARCSMQFSTSPSADPPAQSLKQFSLAHPFTLPAPPQPLQAKLSVQILQPVVSTLSVPQVQGQTSQMKKNAPNFLPKDKGVTNPQTSPHPTNIVQDNTPQSSPSVINHQSPLSVSQNPNDSKQGDDGLLRPAEGEEHHQLFFVALQVQHLPLMPSVNSLEIRLGILPQNENWLRGYLRLFG